MAELLERLRQYGLKGNRNSSNEWVGRCPWHKGNHDTFAVNLKTGMYFCFSAKCHQKGHISKLIGKIDNELDLDDVHLDQFFEPRKDEGGEAYKADIAELEQYKFLHPYIVHRGFEKPFLMNNQIGYDRQNFSITIPTFLEDKYYGCIRRTVLPDVQPKYTYPKGFPKKSILYIPLYVANSHVSSMGRILVVEGSINALKAAQYGYHSASTLGCSPNDEQIEVLIRYARKHNLRITWLYDNDDAGESGISLILRKYFWLDCDVAEIKSLKAVDNGKDLCYTKIVDGKRVPKNDVDELSKKELDYIVSQAKDRFEYELESFGR